MIIALVIDSYDDLNNGTTASARRFVENLRALGHTVRVLTTGEPGPDKYLLKRAWLPLVTYFADKQSITFSKVEEDVIRSCFEGVDVVHFYFPFPMARAAEKIAREMGIPCLAAFHIQPENITYAIGLGRQQWAANFFYWFLKKYFYGRFANIHCPTEFIANELKSHGYEGQTHVISNGVADLFVPPEHLKPEPKGDEPFHILMIGRLVSEKRQDVIIDAVRYSKYKDRIALHFAGKGPKLDKYIKQGSDLPIKPEFGFYKPEELRELIYSCDLYVHAADVEIEAIACMEAFSCGLVPVIANSKKSATVHFALDDRSLFEAGNPKDLAQKIDYWFDHYDEKAKMSEAYAEQGRHYSALSSVKQMVEVYKQLKPGRLCEQKLLEHKPEN